MRWKSFRNKTGSVREQGKKGDGMERRRKKREPAASTRCTDQAESVEISIESENVRK